MIYNEACLIKIDEVRMEHGHVVFGCMANVSQLLNKFGFIIRVKYSVSLQDESCSHNMLQLATMIQTCL